MDINDLENERTELAALASFLAATAQAVSPEAPTLEAAAPTPEPEPDLPTLWSDVKKTEAELSASRNREAELAQELEDTRAKSSELESKVRELKQRVAKLLGITPERPAPQQVVAPTPRVAAPASPASPAPRRKLDNEIVFDCSAPLVAGPSTSEPPEKAAVDALGGFTV